jgi:hypothetical protein
MHSSPEDTIRRPSRLAGRAVLHHDGTIRWPSRSARSVIPSAGLRRSAGAARERKFVDLSWVDRYESLESTFELERLNGRILNNNIHTGSKDDTSAHCNRIGALISSEWILRRREAQASHWQRMATKGGEQWLQYHNKIQL